MIPYNFVLLWEASNTSSSPDLTLRMQSINSPSLCTNQPLITGHRSNFSSVTCVVLLILAFNFTVILLPPCMPFLILYMLTPMLIGRATRIISPPQVPTLYILVVILSPGAPESRKQLHVLQLRQNTGLLPTLLLNSIGCPLCYVILVSHCLPVQSFTVTMSEPLSCAPILSSTPG